MNPTGWPTTAAKLLNESVSQTLTLSDGAEECFILPDPVYNKVMARHSSNLITAGINGLCAPFAVIANFLVVFVIARHTSLHTPSNVFLACLAFSDLMVGVIVQPCYVIFRLMENIRHYVPCTLRILYSESFWVCYGVSFLTLSAISFERYIALRLHLRYKELVTAGGVLKVAVIIWLLDVTLTSFEWVGQNKHLRNCHAMLLLLCLVVTFCTQLKIFAILRRHQRQINSFRSRGSSQRKTFHQQIRLAVSITYIVVVYIACNIPVLFVMVYLFAGGQFNNFNVFSWTETIAFLNSLINPLICYWRSRGIRRAVFNIIAKVFRLKNALSNLKLKTTSLNMAPEAKIHRGNER